MLLQRYYDDSLAQATYLIGCEHAREAIVIDPNVLQRADDLARPHGMKVRYVTETHIHADYLSGSRAMAADAKAQLLLSSYGGADWSYRDTEKRGARLLRDGDTIDVGKVRLTVMHTPGHTPEHIAFLVTDTATGDRPMGLISGDFLFVGDVGRPDLLEKAAKVEGTMESAARDLYRSLLRLKDLPDYLQVWPGHGAGSACGKALGAVPQTTLGYERLYNPALQQKSEEAFVKWVLADQPEPPPYFAIMKQRNRDGWDATTSKRVESLDATGVQRAITQGDQVVDLRSPREFVKAYLPGTINIPGGKSAATYSGTVLRYDKPIILIANNDEQATRVERQLMLIGLSISGIASRAVLDELLAKQKRAMSVIDAQALSDRMTRNGLKVVDVRGRSEWNEGHIPHAQHIYLGDVLPRTADWKRDTPIVVHCQTGSRSSIATTLLEREGFTSVTNFPGGFEEWIRHGLPVAQD